MKDITPEIRAAALEIAIEAARVVQRKGEIPEGHLYAALQGVMTLEGFNTMMNLMKQAGFVKIENHLIIWIGPQDDTQKAEGQGSTNAQ